MNMLPLFFSIGGGDPARKKVVEDNKKQYGEIDSKNGVLHKEIRTTGEISLRKVLGGFKNATNQHNKITEIFFIKKTTNEAIKLFSSMKFNVVALNYANANSVGGGVEEGATAQEEELCRTSPMLYNSLQQFSHGKKIGDRYRYIDWGDEQWDTKIYFTPNVIFRREDGRNSDPYKKLASPYSATIVTAAAPDWRHWRFTGGYFTSIDWKNNLIKIHETEIADKLKNTIEYIYYANILAKTNAHKINWQKPVHETAIPVEELVNDERTLLLLGPWGCGAFAPDNISSSVPDKDKKQMLRHMKGEYIKFMAQQFASVLSNIKKKYDVICFTFLPDDNNFMYFLEVFQKFEMHFKVTII